MSKYFVSKTDTHRIDLGDGQWIDILAVCSHKTQKKAMSAMLKSDASATNKDVKINMDYDAGAFNDVLLKEMIVAWSFEGVPVTPENIDNLAASVAKLVVEEINKLNPLRNEPEKNAL